MLWFTISFQNQGNCLLSILILIDYASSTIIIFAAKTATTMVITIVTTLTNNRNYSDIKNVNKNDKG